MALAGSREENGPRLEGTPVLFGIDDQAVDGSWPRPNEAQLRIAGIKVRGGGPHQSKPDAGRSYRIDCGRRPG